MELIKLITDIIFPRRCPVCDRVLALNGTLICEDCRDRLVPVGQNSCRKCGKRLNYDRDEYCSDCLREKHSFTKARSVFIYNDAMRRSILRYKEHGRREYAEFYSKAVAAAFGREIKAFRPDGIVAVPVNKKTLKKRGFNQAALIAEKVAESLGIDFYGDYLLRLEEGKEQKALSRTERRKNLKRAFIIRRNDVKLNRVVVLDDVYTTGATADEVSIRLRGAGAESVMVVSLASGAPI